MSFEKCFICSAFHETVKQYSLMVVPFYVPISAVRESILLPCKETQVVDPEDKRAAQVNQSCDCLGLCLVTMQHYSFAA